MLKKLLALLDSDQQTLKRHLALARDRDIAYSHLSRIDNELETAVTYHCRIDLFGLREWLGHQIDVQPFALRRSRATDYHRGRWLTSDHTERHKRHINDSLYHFESPLTHKIRQKKRKCQIFAATKIRHSRIIEKNGEHKP